MPRITLIGYRGTGKSTVAAILAKELGCGWCDADTVLEERLGATIAAVIRDRGEPAFRDAEERVLVDLMAWDGVVATGGGVVLRAANRDMLRLRGRPIVWLRAPADVLGRRLAADPTTATRRPSLTGSDPLMEVAATLHVREPLYRECADVAFDTGNEPPESVAARIVGWLAATGGEAR
jgi:shikimate kinase